MVVADEHSSRKPPPSHFADVRAGVQPGLGLLIVFRGKIWSIDLEIQPLVALQPRDVFGLGEARLEGKQA
jgi:hypothetical protein